MPGRVTMASEIDEQIPAPVQRFILLCVTLHSLIQVGGAQDPEKCATAMVAIADAAVRRMNGEPEPAP